MLCCTSLPAWLAINPSRLLRSIHHAARSTTAIQEIQKKRDAAIAEHISNARLVEQITADAGLTFGRTLYLDVFSPVGSFAPSYIDMMRFNVRTMTAAINGD